MMISIWKLWRFFFINDRIEFKQSIFKSLTINQIKNLKKKIDEESVQTKLRMENLERERNDCLVNIGNLLHHSVPISDNEENNQIERTFGDCNIKKQYSHVTPKSD